MYFWQQERTLVYKAVQLWNIQCSLLCVRWSFSAYQSSESTLTMQIAVYYFSLSGRLLWQLPEMSWKSILLVTVPVRPSGWPSFSQQKYQNSIHDIRSGVQPFILPLRDSLCVLKAKSLMWLQKNHTWQYVGRLGFFVCCVIFCFEVCFFLLFNLFGLLKWYLLSLSLIKELRSLVNFSVDVSGFDVSLFPPFLSLGFLFF